MPLVFDGTIRSESELDKTGKFRLQLDSQLLSGIARWRREPSDKGKFIEGLAVQGSSVALLLYSAPLLKKEWDSSRARLP